MKKSIVCVFSKTPGVSSVKTRLAKSVGKEWAVEYFARSLKITLDEITSWDMDYVVAVAEEKVSSYWKGFNTVSQVQGNLGQRLAEIYKKYISLYDNVYFMGADSFHIDFKALEKSLLKFEKSSFSHLLGPAKDGGFYIFGGKKEMDDSIWLNTTYSNDKTSKELLSHLGAPAMILKEEFDIDEIEDLRELVELESKDLTKEQKDLVLKAKKLLSKI